MEQKLLYIIIRERKNNSVILEGEREVDQHMQAMSP